MKHTLILVFLFIGANSFASYTYPSDWWVNIPVSHRHGRWEILPQEAKTGEVILSKRTELGVFSNLSFTPFIFENIIYNSIEGLWQGMKYPDPTDINDPRNNFSAKYPYTRSEVYLLSGFESKKAGAIANKINKENDIDWVSYKKFKFNYKDMGLGSQFHYKIISEATSEKVYQSNQLIDLLLKTKGLNLRPDHLQSKRSPSSYYYGKILMSLRNKL